MNYRRLKDKTYEKIYRNIVYPTTYLTMPEPIFCVHTMQKTGTNTLRFTLYRHTYRPTFYIHNLNRKHDKLERRRKFRRRLGNTYFRFWGNFVLERYIQQNRKIKVITSMRELVGRDVSWFFQRFQRVHRQDINDFRNNISYLQEKFYDDYVTLQKENIWFERETHQVLGINIFDYPFPKEQGYQIINHNHIDLLLMRLETPDSAKEQALSEFLDIPNIKLYLANIGANRSYSDLYRQFKQQLQLPNAYIDFHYQSKLMTYFYSNAEIEGFRQQWNII